MIKVPGWSVPHPATTALKPVKFLLAADEVGKQTGCTQAVQYKFFEHFEKPLLRTTLTCEIY
jgi:hypothetical protein